MGPDDRQAALERFERAVQLPLLILALAMVPLVLVPLLVDLPGPLDGAVVAGSASAAAVTAGIAACRGETRGRGASTSTPEMIVMCAVAGGSAALSRSHACRCRAAAERRFVARGADVDEQNGSAGSRPATAHR